MTSVDWFLLRPIIEQLFELPESEHEALLDRTCGDDTAMRRLVLSMYAQEGGGASVGRTPEVPAEMPAEMDAVPEFVAAVGAQVGAWRLLERVAREGADESWRGERADGEFEMQALIRLLPVRLSEDAQRQQFEAEQQSLARLEHACIARLFDGGTTQDGRLWLVYEECTGPPLDRFADEERVGIEGRLELFRQVCEAVHHAHAHLQLHGDLSPVSIGVSASGPKLLDVGVAKLFHLGEPWVEGHEPPGADPRYASPEQLCGEWATTAADVYSLGMLLHELLTGRPAYDTEAVRPLELTRFVCDTAPETPSASVREGDDVRERAAARGARPRALSRRLAGDLDAIVGKALRKAPAQRYPGAGLLAADIQLHLDERPVRARGDGLRYRARKFCQRHRSLVNSAALAAALLVVVSLEVGGFALSEHRKAAQVSAVSAEQARLYGRDAGLISTLLDRSLEASLGVADGFGGPEGTEDSRQVIDAAMADLDHLRSLVDGDSRVRAALARAYVRLGDAGATRPIPTKATLTGPPKAIGRLPRSPGSCPPTSRRHGTCRRCARRVGAPRRSPPERWRSRVGTSRGPCSCGHGSRRRLPETSRLAPGWP